MPDIVSIITGAYADVWRERLAWARLAGPAVLGLSVLNTLLHELTIGQELLFTLMATQFAVAWHRRQLLGEEPVSWWSIYQWGRPFGRYLLSFMGISLLTAPVVIGAHAFSFYVASALLGGQSPWVSSVSWLLSLPLMLPALLMWARLSPCLAAAVMDEPWSFRQAWQRTRGQGWSIGLLMLFVTGPAALFSLACTVMAAGTQGAVTGVLILLSCALTFVAVALLSSALSMLYTQLTQACATEGAQDRAPAPTGRVEPSADTGWWRYVLDAMVSGVVLGGVAFVLGFFIYPLFQPSNLAPLTGFILAPFGMLIGVLVGLLWKAHALRQARLLRWGIAVAVGALTVGLTMSSWFIPGLMVRSLLLNLAWLPTVLKKPLAPAGTLAVWAMDIPPGEQAAYRERLSAYLGGPLLGMRGHHELHFHTALSVGKALREARAQRRLPDVLVGRQVASVDAVLGESGTGASWQQVVGSGPLTRIGPWVYIQRSGAHRALARALALQGRACGGRAINEQTSPALRQALAEQSQSLARAIVQRQALPVGALAPMSLTHAPMDLQAPVHVVSSQLCGVWGSSTLALAEVAIQIEAADTIGQRRLSLALTQEGAAWMLLSVSELDETRESVAAQVGRLEQSLMSRHGSQPLNDLAEPSEPQDFVPSSLATQRSGYLIWVPSPAPGVVAEVAEIACRARDLRGALHDDVQWSIHVRDPAQDNRYYLHARQLCPQGWPWKWRLWTVTAGELRVSEEQLIPTVGD